MRVTACVLVYALLILLSAVFAVPFLWTLSTALKSPEAVFAFPPQWIPNPAQWDNFVKAWTSQPFTHWVLNTLFVTLVCTVGGTLSASLVAYGFARFRFRGKDAVFVVMLSTLMLPAQVTMIPTFMLWREAGAIDTYAPLTIPAFFGGGAFFIFLLRQFFLTVPRELDEAAMIDGAGPLRVWWSVLMPLSKPALATVAVFSLIGHWDDFLGPLIYLNTPEKYTVSIGLRMFQDAMSTNTELLMAAALIHTAPMILLFFLAQRYFVKGIATAGFAGR
jgi:multiple sugar transport system permease protein